MMSTKREPSMNVMLWRMTCPELNNCSNVRGVRPDIN